MPVKLLRMIWKRLNVTNKYIWEGEFVDAESDDDSQEDLPSLSAVSNSDIDRNNLNTARISVTDRSYHLNNNFDHFSSETVGKKMIRNMVPRKLELEIVTLFSLTFSNQK